MSFGFFIVSSLMLLIVVCLLLLSVNRHLTKPSPPIKLPHPLWRGIIYINKEGAVPCDIAQNNAHISNLIQECSTEYIIIQMRADILGGRLCHE